MEDGCLPHIILHMAARKSSWCPAAEISSTGKCQHGYCCHRTLTRAACTRFFRFSKTITMTSYIRVSTGSLARWESRRQTASASTLTSSWRAELCTVSAGEALMDYAPVTGTRSTGSRPRVMRGLCLHVMSLRHRSRRIRPQPSTPPQGGMVTTSKNRYHRRSRPTPLKRGTYPRQGGDRYPRQGGAYLNPRDLNPMNLKPKKTPP